MLAHIFEDIAVPDRRAGERQADGLEIALEPEIGHDGRDNAGLRKFPVLLPTLRHHRHQLVAIDQPAVLINDDHAVGVAIQRNADVRPQFPHLLRQRFRRGRADVAVDVHAVRLDAQGKDFRAQFPQRFRRHLVGRAIGAVDDHAHALEGHVARQRVLGEFDIARAHVIDAARPAQV